MEIGEKLYQLRKQNNYSQEEIAEKLNVSRQTISKWETEQTLPDIEKTKELSKLYNVSFDYLINNNQISGDVTNIEAIVDEVDWTAAWSKKYPILASYPNIRGIQEYEEKINELYQEFQNQFHTNNTDTVLILKDILYQKYQKERKK